MKFFKNTIIITLISSLMISCARDLSNITYTQDSTLNMTLEGKIIAVRQVLIKNSDKLSDNNIGILAGGAAGGALASTSSDRGSNYGALIVGGILVGSVVGSLVEGQLGKANGYEYIIEVDTSKLKTDYYEGSAILRDALASVKTSGLITIVQGKDNLMQIGQNVYLIISSKRARVVAK